MIWIVLFLNLFTSWIFPWWIFMVWAFVLGWYESSGARAFLSVALGTGCAWVMVAYYQDLKSQGLISMRVAKMFQLSHSSLIFVLIFLMAGIASGLVALTAYLVRQPLKQQLQRKG